MNRLHEAVRLVTTTRSGSNERRPQWQRQSIAARVLVEEEAAPFCPPVTAVPVPAAQAVPLNDPLSSVFGMFEAATAAALPVARIVEDARTISTEHVGEEGERVRRWWVERIHYLKAVLAVLTLSVLGLTSALVLLLPPPPAWGPTVELMGLLGFSSLCPGGPSSASSLAVTDYVGVYERSFDEFYDYAAAIVDGAADNNGSAIPGCCGVQSADCRAHLLEVAYNFGNVRWRLSNGVSWSLRWSEEDAEGADTGDDGTRGKGGTLRTGKDCPYGEGLEVGVELGACARRGYGGKEGVRETFKFEVHALTFNGAVYRKI